MLQRCSTPSSEFLLFRAHWYRLLCCKASVHQPAPIQPIFNNVHQGCVLQNSHLPSYQPCPHGPGLVVGSGVCGQAEYCAVACFKYHKRTPPLTSSSLASWSRDTPTSICRSKNSSQRLSHKLSNLHSKTCLRNHLINGGNLQ